MSRVLAALIESFCSYLCSKISRRFRNAFLYTLTALTITIIFGTLVFLIVNGAKYSCHYVFWRNRTKKPNIIFMVVDDLGWNDVSWNNPDIKTPTINRLVEEGVVLTHAYTHAAVAPSRAAMLTGQYSHKLGLQDNDIGTFQAKRVPRNIRLLPEELKKLGYSTNLIGKWNLGHCNLSYTPTNRGFDAFYGSLYSHQSPYTSEWDGILDFWEDNNPASYPLGTSSMDMYFKRAHDIIFNHCKKCGKSKPFFIQLGLSARINNGFPSSLRQKRLKFDQMGEKARIMKKIDAGIEDILYLLYKTGAVDNTLIVLTSGNGGDVVGDRNTNLPLRGGKFTLWEGGARIPVVVQGRMVRYEGRSHHDLFHAVDWFPTLLHAAGKPPSQLGDAIDGISHWNALQQPVKLPKERQEIVYNIADQHAAIRFGDYKFVLGNPVQTSYASMISELGLNPNCAQYRKSSYSTKVESCFTRIENKMLYDIVEDPSEEHNILMYLSRIGVLLEDKIKDHMKKMVPPQSEISHKKDVKVKDGVLFPGWC